jgi:hypothetical protein
MKNEKIEKIKAYLENCERMKKELEKIQKEKDDIRIPSQTEFLPNKNEIDLINKFLIEKEETLKTILAQIFKNNSVIIDGELSLRGGEFRRYRGQYNLGLMEVKQKIYKYANYLKLTEEEKDVLDYCLKLVDYNDFDRGITNVTERWNDKEKDLEKTSNYSR